ncbi:MAG: hypothetical protein GY787_20350 [Alteromonadales bacterium]|nr:hypothetical protein [Alteromonadales bacterium]
MRIPTFPEFLFASSMIFLIAFVSAFNYELDGGKPLCELNLLSEKKEICILTDSSITDFRVVIHSGGSNKTVTIKVPITITVSDDTGVRVFDNIVPKSASTSGGRRFYSNHKI